MLKTVIGQIDQVAAEVKIEMDKVRESRTLKRKHEYIPQMATTIGSLMSSKITAIRELNNSKTQAHNLEFKRMKEINNGAAAQKDDDSALFDMYNAFISMPGQPGVQQYQAPSILDITGPSMGGGGSISSNIVRANLGGDQSGYEQYQQKIDLKYRAMRHESNPNVKTVVVYNKLNGSRYFDVMDVSTGQSIPGVQRPDPMFLEDTTLDINSGIARNTNLDQIYPIIVIGNDASNNY